MLIAYERCQAGKEREALCGFPERSVQLECLQGVGRAVNVFLKVGVTSAAILASSAFIIFPVGVTGIEGINKMCEGCL